MPKTVGIVGLYIDPPDNAVVLSVDDIVTLDLLPQCGRVAIEVDGRVSCYAAEGQSLELRSRPGGARVVRLGETTFYQRARRKLRITDSAEIPLPRSAGDLNAGGLDVASDLDA